MTAITANHKNTDFLPAHAVLTVVASADGSGSIVRLSDPPGGQPQGTTEIAAGETKRIGPFGIPTYHRVECDEGTLTYTIGLADFEASDETAKGAIASYIVSDTGTKTLMAAAREDRIVHIVVHVTTVFANGDGAQPTLLVGETGDTDKFAAAAVFTDAVDEAKIVLIGTLAAGKALLLTQTAGTGTTMTGAYTVSAQAAPLV